MSFRPAVGVLKDLSYREPYEPYSMPAQMQQTSSPVDFSRSIDFHFVKCKTAVVTGGASGVGNGVVRALAQNGAVVVIADTNEENGAMAADTFRRGGLAYVGPLEDFAYIVGVPTENHSSAFISSERTSPTGHRNSPPSKQQFNFRRVKRSTSLSRALD